MVSHVEKTLKTKLQKKLPKSQKFARNISVAEFRYSQTSFLRFTVILFHSVWTKKERAKSNEQRVKGKEQRVKCKEQRAKSNEQQAKSNERRATS